MHASRLHADGEASPELVVTDQLCQSVAHDLRGVLMAIQLSAEEVTTPGSRALELQAELLASIERATELATELTTVARPGGGHAEVFDVSLVIDQMQRMLRRNAPAGVGLRLELAREPCFVAAPRMAFKRALLTLFNRVAARLPPGRTLAIETAVSEERPSARVSVFVGDDAEGRDWAAAAPAFPEQASPPGSEALAALIQRLDAELYALGDFESSPQFRLTLSGVRAPVVR